MTKLSELTLGYADGKNEAEKEWFTDLFYTDNHMVDRVISERSVFIISGRKGTGKTILAKYIEKTYAESGFITKVIDKEELFLNYILEKTEEPLSRTALSAFLRYCILLAVSKLMIEKEKAIIETAEKRDGFFPAIKCRFKLSELKKFYYDVYPKGHLRLAQVS